MVPCNLKASSYPHLEIMVNVSEFHAGVPQAIASEGLAQFFYVAAKAAFEPTTPSDERRRIYQ